MALLPMSDPVSKPAKAVVYAPTNLLSFQDSSMTDMDPDYSWEFAISPQGKFHGRFSREV